MPIVKAVTMNARSKKNSFLIMNNSRGIDDQSNVIPYILRTCEKSKIDRLATSQETDGKAKKLQMQGAQILRNEAYL
jgi:hypothetical protein